MKKFQWKNVTQVLKKGKKKWILTAVVICVVIIGAGYIIVRKSKTQGQKNSKQMETTVSVGTIQTSVSGTGTISYADSTDIVLPSDLEISELLVSEGSYVTEGMLLATVDETSLTACLTAVQEAISDVDSTISSEKSSSTTKSIKAGVAGRVKKIYAEADDSVVAVMKEQGALMLLSTDDYMAVKIEGAANINAGDEVTVSSGDTDTEGTVESVENGTAVITFDDSVFEYEEEVTVSNADGAALGKGNAYIHAPLKVVGTSGIISALNVSLNGEVSASTNVYTLEDNSQSAAYAQAVKEREELVALLDTLVSIQADGGITASSEGMIETISIDSSSSSENSSSGNGMTMGEISNENVASESADSENIEIELADVDNISEKNVAKEDISAPGSTGFVTMSTMSQTGNALAEGDAENVSLAGTASKIAAAAPEGITGGAGEISGTTEAMEYAEKEDAAEWKPCTAGSTKVASGTWYVRYKETDAALASPAVQVVVTEEGSTKGNPSEENPASSKETEEKKTTSTESEKAAASDNTSEKSASGNANNQNTTSNAGITKTGSSSGSSSSASSSSTESSDTSLVETVSAFTIANGDKMVVTMNVDELDILSMKEGLSAEITLDAVTGTTFTGEITSVSRSASSGDGVAQYPVEITFDKTEDMLSGMNASIEVIMEQAENVLVVPLTAVVDEGNASYVYTGFDQSSGELTGKVQVTLGLSDENNVEIQSGLSEGDTVYYMIKGSEESSSLTGNGMGGFGMPGNMQSGGRGDMKMNGQSPTGSGDRPYKNSQGN
ncbi:MAG: HlyD family efflux transporter periplasmic adaptor subunit [Lachnospiraceae bacterium]